jgi:hypothetical protein
MPRSLDRSKAGSSPVSIKLANYPLGRFRSVPWSSRIITTSSMTIAPHRAAIQRWPLVKAPSAAAVR